MINPVKHTSTWIIRAANGQAIMCLIVAFTKE